MDKQWIYLNTDYDREALVALSGKEHLSPAVCMALLNRGITDKNADGYFGISPDTLHDPFLMRDMDKAAERINRAVAAGEKVCIYGDYDADGVSSTAMLSLYLEKKGVACKVYIPKREGEGYGINLAAVNKIADDGASLIITVDTGISAVSEIAEAQKMGIDVIVTDHHECGTVLPPAYAVIDPKREDCPYPFKSLAGAGVAFKLLCALEGDTKKCLDDWGEYVALATVADVVGLLGENRTLTKIGIEKIRTKPIPWLDALMAEANITKETVSSYQLAFMAAPRINAAGRMGDAYLALSLMKSRDFDGAAAICAELEAQNTERKNIGDRIFREALEKIKGQDGKKVLVLSGDGWHSGVIGIIASRIAETFNKSVVMISLKDGVGSGSARAAEGMNLYDALSASADVLEKFGGHERAAGLTIKEENIARFEEEINAYADSVLEPEDLVPKIYIDCAISCETSLLKLCDEQELLEPFGEGNRKPVFAVLGAQITSIRRTRDGKHLMMRFIKRGRDFSCIGFGMGDFADRFHEGDTVDIAANLDKNEYMGRISPQFHLIDLKTR